MGLLRLEAALVDEALAALFQVVRGLAEAGEALVRGLAVVIAVVDLLHDAGQANRP